MMVTQFCVNQSTKSLRVYRTISRWSEGTLESTNCLSVNLSRVYSAQCGLNCSPVAKQQIVYHKYLKATIPPSKWIQRSLLQNSKVLCSGFTSIHKNLSLFLPTCSCSSLSRAENYWPGPYKNRRFTAHKNLLTDEVLYRCILASHKFNINNP